MHPVKQVGIKKKVWKHVIQQVPTPMAVKIILHRSKSNNNVLHHALWLASMYGRTSLVKALLDHGANINYTKYSISVIEVAVVNARQQIVEILLKRNVDLTKTQQPVLYRAAFHGYINIIKVLLNKQLNKNVDVDIKNYINSTPLWIAASNGHVNAVSLLLKHGADVDCMNLLGTTPIYAASSHGHWRVVTMLRNYCADVNIYSIACPPPLHVAIINNYNKTIMELIKFNCGKSFSALCVALGFVIKMKEKKILMSQRLSSKVGKPTLQSLYGCLIKHILFYIAPPSLRADLNQVHNGNSPIMLAIKHNNDILHQLVN